MGEDYLYKSRVTLINFDILIWLTVCVCGFFVDVVVGVICVVVLLFWVVSIIGMRIYVYEDRIVYKAGFILKTYSKSMLLKNVSIVSYSSDLFGKIFKYGDVVVGVYNERDSFNIKKVKNAKMLVDNINELLRIGDKRAE